MSDMNEIAAVAAEVRAKEIGARDLGDDPPATLCLELSRTLRQALADAGFDAAVIQGKFEVDEPNFEYYDDWDEDEMSAALYTPLHYWAEVTGRGGRAFPEPVVADITADQFNDELDSETDYMEPVEVGPYAHLPRHIRGGEWSEPRVSKWHAVSARIYAALSTVQPYSRVNLSASSAGKPAGTSRMSPGRPTLSSIAATSASRDCGK